jgi:glycosyltransferase involved in cell wall biosynthesis
MPKRVLFYSSIRNEADFKTSLFYRIDISILTELGYTIRTTNRMRDFLTIWDYDIAFIYFYRLGLFVAILARLFGKKVYFTGGIDNLSFQFATRKAVFIQRILYVLCYFVSTKCIIVSQSDYNNILLFWRFNRKNELIPHAIHINNYLRSIPKQKIMTSICWMGSVQNIKRKGIDNLIRAFAIFSKHYPDYKLCLIGREGPGYDYLLQIVEDNNVENSIIFYGAASENEKIDILSKTKYYIQLSKFEGFGMAAIEAMASGCIVIHSGRGGLSETVGNTGVLIRDIDDPNNIAAIMLNCELKNKEYSHLANNAYERVANYYDYERRFAALKKILLV